MDFGEHSIHATNTKIRPGRTGPTVDHRCLCCVSHLARWGAGPGSGNRSGIAAPWPEYDDPGLLVILSGNITGTTTFPQQVAFPIPANARGIQATFIDPNGDLLSQQWQIVDGKLTYSLPSPDFQIEYYLDRPAGGNQRDINSSFSSPPTPSERSKSQLSSRHATPCAIHSAVAAVGAGERRLHDLSCRSCQCSCWRQAACQHPLYQE